MPVENSSNTVWACELSLSKVSSKFVSKKLVLGGNDASLNLSYNHEDKHLFLITKQIY